MTTVLIDGDIVCYRAGFACENDDLAIALWQADQLIQRIIKEIGASECKVFLTGSNNFRYDVYSEYKANRKDARRPKWLQQLREHLVVAWGATVTDGIEADDAMGIAQDKVGGTTVIATIDKDLLMISGEHYNFVTLVHKTISAYEGLQFFYFQLIMGDTADNIKGFDGKSRVKVPKFLEQAVEIVYSCATEKEMYEHVLSMYQEHFPDIDPAERLNVSAQCLWIQQEEGQKWNPPS